MADEDLRLLEREVQENPTDEQAIARFRLACVRQGRPDKAKPIRVGDTVLVTEAEHAWINGPWEAIVVKVEEDGATTLKPTSTDLDFRVKPSPEYLASGIYLTAPDVQRATIVRPVVV